MVIKLCATKDSEPLLVCRGLTFGPNWVWTVLFLYLCFLDWTDSRYRQLFPRTPFKARKNTRETVRGMSGFSLGICTDRQVIGTKQSTEKFKQKSFDEEYLFENRLFQHIL